MPDQDQQAFLKRQAAIKAAHARRVVVQRRKAGDKDSRDGKAKKGGK
jgi:hypothetical protein